MNATVELIARRNNVPTIWEENAAGKAKACPFCGADHIALVEDGEIHWAECSSCGVEGPFDLSRINALKRWNKRQ